MRPVRWMPFLRSGTVTGMPRRDAAQEAADLLSVIPSFAGLDAATLGAVAQAAIRRSCDAGQIVFLEGEPCAGLYVVQDGWLKAVKVSVTGREQVVRFVGPGEGLGEIGALAGGLNQATVEALEPTTVWIVQRDLLLQLMDEHLPLARVINQNLARRVVHLMSLVEDLSLRPVVARLARLLVEQSTGDVLSRRRWSTQAEIAARLGTVPEVLNRALRSLTDEGVIQVERHQITIIDRQGLETKALSNV